MALVFGFARKIHSNIALFHPNPQHNVLLMKETRCISYYQAELTFMKCCKCQPFHFGLIPRLSN